MKQHTKHFIFTLIAVVTPFLILEFGARLFSHTGTYDYIEKRLIEQNFSPKKKKDEFRIFLYGESTMYGNHLYPKSTIDIWMRMYLESLLGKKAADKITIYNLSRLGVDSHFIKQTFLDTIIYKPDLVIFYTAHNDFTLWDNKRDLLNKSFSRKASLFFKELFKQSVFVSACRRVSVRAKLKKEAREVKEKEAPEKWFFHTEKRWKDKKDQFDPGSEGAKELLWMWKENIKEIIAVSTRKKVPVIFFSGLARYNAFDPYVSFHDARMTEEDIKAWEEVYARAGDTFNQGKYKEALTLYEECLKKDPQYALVYFQMGRCYEKLEDYDLARKFYRLASDKDFSPIRGPSGVNQFYEQIAKENYPGIFIIPTQEIFESQSPHGMINDALVVDQLHPTMLGQSFMALKICQVMFEKNLLLDWKDWHWERLKSFRDLSRNITLDEEFEYKALMASAFYVGKYFDEAVVFLNKALAVKPKSLRARSQLAWTYVQLGEIKKASQIYEELAKEFPEESKGFHGIFPDVMPSFK